MIIRKIRPEELKRTKELFSIAFEFPYEGEETSELVYQKASKHPSSREDVCLLEKYGAFEDDDKFMFSCLSAIEYPVNFDGHRVKMAGIGGVSSLPTHRRRGGIRGCFEKMLPDLYAGGTVLSALYPFSTAYYRKYGYEVHGTIYVYELDLSFLRGTGAAGQAVLTDAENRTELLEAVKAVDAVWQERYNGIVLRESWEYRFMTEADPYRKQEFTYVYFGPAGQPLAYMSLEKIREAESQKLKAKRFVFINEEGLRGLLSLASTFAADHRSIQFALPEDLDIEEWIPEFSLGACRIERHHCGMIRVINVKKALEFARYRGSGHAVFAVEDPQIPENNKVFEVTWRDGRAVEVRAGEKGEESADADIASDVATVVASGNASDRVLLTIQELSKYLMGIKSYEPLPDVFYKKPVWLQEYF